MVSNCNGDANRLSYLAQLPHPTTQDAKHLNIPNPETQVSSVRLGAPRIDSLCLEGSRRKLPQCEPEVCFTATKLCSIVRIHIDVAFRIFLCSKPGLVKTWLSCVLGFWSEELQCLN